jgi:3-methyl-2-oxobutanoate hydroxymethyltransferase
MRLTIRDIQKMKDQAEPITMLTAYDAMSATMSETAGVPMLLVGDSMGMVVQGHDSTIPVKLEHIIYHAEIVNRVTKRPLVVGDLPFMTYNVSPEQALANAGRLMQESGVSAVKLEGGAHIAPTIKRIVQAGIPVMAHIGLTPQSVNELGGFHVQGKEVETAQQLIRDAEAVQDAGAFAVVLELMTSSLAELITERLHIPTIGIGAGLHCDGQVQVFHDILALYGDFVPRHTRRYTNAGDLMRQAIGDYVRDVQARKFPTADNSVDMKADVLGELREVEVNGHGHR